MRPSPTLSLLGGRVRVPRGTLVLIGLTSLCSLVAVHAGEAGVRWLVLDNQTLPGLRLPALLTNSFVDFHPSPVGLLILLALTGYFLQAELRFVWATRRNHVIGVVAGTFAGLYLFDRLLFRSAGVWGLLASLLLLLWFAPLYERRHGERRLLRFVAQVAVLTNLLGAALLWVWPGSVFSLVGGGGLPVFGTHALNDALMTVWALGLGRARLAFLKVEAYKLAWVLVILQGFNLVFRGFAAGSMGLAAIGLAWLHASRRVRSPRPRPRLGVIDGGRRGPRGPTLH